MNRAPDMPLLPSTQGPGAITSADTTAPNGPAGLPPPRTALPLGQENLDYTQSKGETWHPSAETEHTAARNLNP